MGNAALFNANTRHKRASLPAQAFSYGQTLQFPINRVGLLQGIVVTVRGTTLTLTGGANAHGYCALIRRLKLVLNSGMVLFDVSGPGYHYGLAPHLDNVFNPFLSTPPGVTSGPRSAIASGQTFAVDFYIPCAPNLRDPQALLMLQNEQLQATVTVECETQVNIAATSLTYSVGPTITVYPVWFTLPPTDEAMPDTLFFQRIIETTQSVTVQGDNYYTWARNDIYLQMIHLTTADTASRPTATFSDIWNRFRIAVNTSDYIYDYDVPLMDVTHALQTGQVRVVGHIGNNFMASAGLGMYDQARDVIRSGDYSDLKSIITTTQSTGIIVNIARTLVPLGQA